MPSAARPRRLAYASWRLSARARARVPPSDVLGSSEARRFAVLRGRHRFRLILQAPRDVSLQDYPRLASGRAEARYRRRSTSTSTRSASCRSVGMWWGGPPRHHRMRQVRDWALRNKIAPSRLNGRTTATAGPLITLFPRPSTGHNGCDTAQRARSCWPSGSHPVKLTIGENASQSGVLIWVRE